MAKTTPLSEDMIAFYRLAPGLIPGWPVDLTLHGFSAGVFRDVARSDWKDHPDRTVKHWDWWKWHATFATTDTRFECAVRQEGVLMGLVLGRVRPASGTESKRIEVWYLEARPGRHSMKGKMLVLLLECAHYYGAAVGAAELRIVAPLSEVLRLYEALGFRTVLEGQTAIYCVKAF